MHNLRTRSLVLVPFAALIALAPLSAYATDYKAYAVFDSEDLVKTSSPVDSAFGYNMTTNVTIPVSVAPNTPYTITINGTSLGSSAGLWCDNSGGGHTSCGLGNSQGYAQKNGVGPVVQGTSTAGPVTVTSGASGSDSIKVFTDVWASNGWGCNNWKGACSVPGGTNYLSVPIAAATPPTVSIWFQ